MVTPHTAEVVTGPWRDPIDAADELIEIAHQTGELIQMPAYLRDSLVAQWRLRGVGYYREDLPRELCGNVYERQGYDAAAAADVQPVRSTWGWPVLAGAAD